MGPPKHTDAERSDAVRADGPGAGADAGREISPAVTPPAGNPRFPLIDPMRGLAVAAVVLIHVALVSGALDGSTYGNAIQALGTYALPVLFALSGFLMYRPFVAARYRQRAKPQLSGYIRRRLLRIVPAYWFALTILGLTLDLQGVFTSDWWRYYFFMQIYDSRTLGGGIPQAWSLNVEITFYIALPIWAWAMRTKVTGSNPRSWFRFDLYALLTVAWIGGVVQVLAAQQVVPYLVGQSMLGQSTWLCVGMALAVASVASQHGVLKAPKGVALLAGHPGLSWGIALACFIALVALVPNGGLFANVAVITQVVSTPGEDIAKVLLGAGMSALLLIPTIFGNASQGLIRRFLSRPQVAWFGLISYGVYLWHLTLSSVLGLAEDPAHYSVHVGLDLVRAFPGPDTLTLFISTLGTSTAIAAFSYYVVELPFLRKKPGFAKTHDAKS